MVTINSPGLSSADVTDAVGSTANDGLTFDSATNSLDVDVGSELAINANGKVDIAGATIEETALAYDFVGGA
jgi:hypothetical protein